MWNLARKANLGDSPQYHFLTLPDPKVIDEVSVDMLRQWHKPTFTQSGLKLWSPAPFLGKMLADQLIPCSLICPKGPYLSRQTLTQR